MLPGLTRAYATDDLRRPRLLVRHHHAPPATREGSSEKTAGTAVAGIVPALDRTGEANRADAASWTIRSSRSAHWRSSSRCRTGGRNAGSSGPTILCIGRIRGASRGTPGPERSASASKRLAARLVQKKLLVQNDQSPHGPWHTLPTRVYTDCAVTVKHLLHRNTRSTRVQRDRYALHRDTCSNPRPFF